MTATLGTDPAAAVRQGRLTGVTFDIQGFSVHDGPGCRTVVFLKGCPLRCAWCANPEAVDPCPEPLLQSSQCDACEQCLPACPSRAIAIADGQLTIDRASCSSCDGFPCVGACPRGALEITGKEIELDQLMRVLQRDRHYWGPDGGVTLTGGEPLFQRRFATELLRRCSASGMHTAIETCGHASAAAYLDCLPLLDWIFFDIKHMSSKIHESGTGRGNSLILENARIIGESFPGRLVFRTPLIPGFNDSTADLIAIAEFIASVGRPDPEINVLPVHHLAREKYRKLGRDYPMDEQCRVSDADLARASQIFAAADVTCHLGSDTPF